METFEIICEDFDGNLLFSSDFPPQICGLNEHWDGTKLIKKGNYWSLTGNLLPGIYLSKLLVIIYNFTPRDIFIQI